MTAGEVTHQARAVGIVAMPRIAVAHESVDRAGAARARGEFAARGRGLLLERQRHVRARAAGEP